MFKQIVLPFFRPTLNKAMAIALGVGLLVNGFLCYERKVLQAEAQSHRTEAALIRADNQNLANQLERANLAIVQYREQVKALHENVLHRLQQAEQRSNELITELDKHQNWRNQPIPSGVGKLLNARSGKVSSNPTHAPNVPNKPPVPNTKLPTQK